MAEFQVAWPSTQLVPGALQDFLDRWAAWLAAAVRGRRSRPSQMPERDAQGHGDDLEAVIPPSPRSPSAAAAPRRLRRSHIGWRAAWSVATTCRDV